LQREPRRDPLFDLQVMGSLMEGLVTSLENRAVVAIRTAARESRAEDEHGNRFALVSIAYVKTFGILRPILTTDVFLVEATEYMERAPSLRVGRRRLARNRNR
jgi:hypothetical protein